MAAGTYRENLAVLITAKLYGAFPSYGGNWSSRNPSAYASVIQGTDQGSMIIWTQSNSTGNITELSAGACADPEI